MLVALNADDCPSCLVDETLGICTLSPNYNFILVAVRCYDGEARQMVSTTPFVVMWHQLYDSELLSKGTASTSPFHVLSARGIIVRHTYTSHWRLQDSQDEIRSGNNAAFDGEWLWYVMDIRARVHRDMKAPWALI